MRKNCRKLLAVLLGLALVVSLCACGGQAATEPSSPESDSSSGQSEPEAAPEEPKTAVEIIMDSYYQDEHPEIKADDAHPLPGPVVGRVAPWYTTDTGDREKLEALLEKLRNGERLSDNLTAETSLVMGGAEEPWGEALVYDEAGEVRGHAQVSLVTGEVLGVWDYSDPNEDFFPDFYRNDFRWPQLLETAIAEGKIDPDNAKLTACNFASFATGAVLYDDQREYFIPTNRTALHRVDFEVGIILYPVPALAEMLQESIDVLFGYPPMSTGAANTSADPEPEGRPEVWMEEPGRKEYGGDDVDTIKAVWEPLNEAVQRLSQEDEALTGLTQFNLLAQLQYDTYDDVRAYYPFRNSEKEIVTYRAIHCSIARGEDGEFHILEVFSFEEWEQE